MFLESRRKRNFNRGRKRSVLRGKAESQEEWFHRNSAWCVKEYKYRTGCNWKVVYNDRKWLSTNQTRRLSSIRDTSNFAGWNFCANNRKGKPGQLSILGTVNRVIAFNMEKSRIRESFLVSWTVIRSISITIACERIRLPTNCQRLCFSIGHRDANQVKTYDGTVSKCKTSRRVYYYY